MNSEKRPDGSELSFAETVIHNAQYVEYKVSHYLDKAVESMTGFVSVLPGAFSTFRWKCIYGEPLDKFLKGSIDEFENLAELRRCQTANKYLAEDRIMCLEILSKRDEDFIIHYVPGAKCITDVPVNLTQLIKQRRRWHNGTLFASFYLLTHMCRIWNRKQETYIRNLALMVLYLYLFITVALSFISVGVYYAVFSIFLREILPSDQCLSITTAANIVENIYIILLLVALFMSVSVDVDWAERWFRTLSFLMGLFSCLLIIGSIFKALNSTLDSLGVIFLVSVGLFYLIPMLLNFKYIRVVDFLKGIFSALYLVPTYVNVIAIYSI